MTANAQPTKFFLPSGVGYDAQLLDYKHERGQVRARIEVSPEVWESVDLVMLFNLKWDNRNPGSVSGDNPVEITLVLSKNLYSELQKTNALLADSVAFLNAPPDHPMKSTTQWYAIEITEGVTLPGELKDKGTLRQGFTTKWKEEFSNDK